MVRTQELSPEDLAQPILIRINADDCCRHIFSEEMTIGDQSFSFSQYVQFLADAYVNDKKIMPIVTSACGQCEFRVEEEELRQGLKSGFHECWKEALNYSDEDFAEPTVLEIWNFRKKNQLIQKQRIKLSD